jgi:hypothetical protein
MQAIPTGFYPFWFWNDTLTEDEVRWQIAQMAAQGVRGFFIHPRQGLGQPYLSESFFRMVDAAVEAAEEHDLLVHLYDEYPYPSGIAGGEVTLGNPAAYATRLEQRTFDVLGGAVRRSLPRGKVLSCVAYPLVDGAVDWTRGHDLRDAVGPVLVRDSFIEMGLTDYNRKRYFASEPTPILETVLPEGPHRIFVSVQTVITHHKYWNHTVDVLNPEAIARFIQLTHERYYARYGDRFGKTLISIFVDETEPGWSDRLPEAFEEAYGYALAPKLPALQDASHPAHDRVTRDFETLQYRLFCKTFEAPISTWCETHGLAYSGEKPSMRMAQLRYMDIPGCEPGHTKAGAKPDWLQARLRSNAKATASAAYFYEKTGSLCECYHSTGWSATLQDAKAIADGLLLAGIDFLVPHGFFYSTHGLKKHDAPPTFFFQMPFWPHFGRLSDYVDRIGDAFAGTHIDAEVLVVDPASGRPSMADMNCYENLLWALMHAHLDVHIVDTDILTEAALEEGAIRVRDVTAKVILVPPMREVEPPLRVWLDCFAEAGGTVIRWEDTPDLNAVMDRVQQHVQPSLRVRGATGAEVGEVLVVKRVGAGRTLWFGYNVGVDAQTVTLDAGGALAEIPLDPDRPAALQTTDDGRYRRTLAPFESFLLEAVPSDETSPESGEALPHLTIPITGPARVAPHASNLMRLDTWRMAIRQPDRTYGPEAAVEAQPLANQLARSELPFVPHIRGYFGHEPALTLPDMTVRYRLTFENAYDGPVALVMEPGSLVGAWQLTLNGTDPLRAEDFTPTDHHVRGSLGVDVTDRLVQGENVLHVEVTTDRTDGGLRNPLYLAGDFGVALDPLSLVPPRQEGAFEAYEANGLPFYAGAITYTTTFTLPAGPAGDRVRVAFDYPEPFHEATEVSINGSPFQSVDWTPREVVLPVRFLHAGENTLRTRVLTTLIRSFEGQWFDYEAHRYRDVGDT